MGDTQEMHVRFARGEREIRRRCAEDAQKMRRRCICSGRSRYSPTGAPCEIRARFPARVLRTSRSIVTCVSLSCYTAARDARLRCPDALPAARQAEEAEHIEATLERVGDQASEVVVDEARRCAAQGAFVVGKAVNAARATLLLSTLPPPPASPPICLIPVPLTPLPALVQHAQAFLPCILTALLPPDVSWT